MPRSIHDNHVLGYRVDIERRSIVVHTRSPDWEPHERTDIRFEGVLGYAIRDSLGGILNMVYAVEFEEIVRDSAFSPLFEQWANQAWPFQGAEGDPVAYARAAGATAYVIDSSIGFDGFVVCQSMTIEAAEP